MFNLEAIAGGMLGGILSRFRSDGRSAHALPEPGVKCLNCETELTGRYCHACGQEFSNQHRSILHLTYEAVEGLFHVDGRLWRTIPRLFFKPGLLAREYVEGKRARHVPPFRTFLISLLLFILSAEGVLHKWTHDLKAGHDTGGMNVNVRGADGVPVPVVKDGRLVGQDAHPAKPAERPDQVTTRVGPTVGDMKDGKVVDAEGKVLADGIPTPRSLIQDIKREGASGQNPAEFDRKMNWLEGQARKVAESPEYFMMIAFGWGHRLAVLLLPIFAGFLTLLYVYRREIFVYDHLIVSMNYLSFIFLSFAIALVLPGPLKGWAALVAILWSPANLFVTLRGAYGSGVISAILKTSFLWVTTIFLFASLILGLMTIGFTQI